MHMIYVVRMAIMQECLDSFGTMYLSKLLCCDMLIFILLLFSVFSVFVFQIKVTPPLVFRTTHLFPCVPLHRVQGKSTEWQLCNVAVAGGDQKYGVFLFHQWENYKCKECLQKNRLVAYNSTLEVLKLVEYDVNMGAVLSWRDLLKTLPVVDFDLPTQAIVEVDHPPLKFVWFDCFFVLGYMKMIHQYSYSQPGCSPVFLPLLLFSTILYWRGSRMIGCLSDLVSIYPPVDRLWGLPSPRFDWVPGSEWYKLQKKTSWKCAKFIMCQQFFVFERLSYNIIIDYKLDIEANLYTLRLELNSHESHCDSTMIAFRWWRNLQNLLPKRPSPSPNGNAPKTSGLFLGGGGRRRWWWWWSGTVALPENPLMLRVYVMHSICIPGFMLDVHISLRTSVWEALVPHICCPEPTIKVGVVMSWNLPPKVF